MVVMDQSVLRSGAGGPRGFLQQQPQEDKDRARPHGGPQDSWSCYGAARADTWARTA